MPPSRGCDVLAVGPPLTPSHTHSDFLNSGPWDSASVSRLLLGAQPRQPCGRVLQPGGVSPPSQPCLRALPVPLKAVLALGPDRAAALMTAVRSLAHRLTRLRVGQDPAAEIPGLAKIQPLRSHPMGSPVAAGGWCPALVPGLGRGFPPESPGQHRPRPLPALSL